MKNLIILLCTLTSVISANCQSPDWVWVNQSLSNIPHHADGGALASDSSGNMYLTGSFNTSIDFGIGVLTSYGDDDAFLMKFDTSGSVIWSVKCGGPNSDYAGAVDVDANGDICIAGAYNGTANIGNVSLSGIGNNAFLAKYDSLGNVLWANTIFPGQAWEIVTDKANNIYVAGIKTGAIAGESFLAKYNSDGVFQWSRNAVMTSYGGGSNSHSYGVDVDGLGNIYTISNFNGQAEIDGNIYLPTLTTGGYDVLVIKYSTNGDILWLEQIQTQVGTTTADDLLVLNNGTFIVTGGFDGAMITGSDTSFSINPSLDMYLTCFDTSGTHLWTETNSEGIRGNDLTSDLSNSIYLVGSRVSEDLLVDKYSATGNLQWEKYILGTVSSGNVGGICRDLYGDIYVGEAVSGITDFDSIEVTPNANRDIFWAKMGSMCLTNPMTIEVNQSSSGVECSGIVDLVVSGGASPYTYQWDVNAESQVTSSISEVCSGVYCAIVTDANGCSQNVCLTVSITVGIEGKQDPNSVAVYPNPTNGLLSIDLDGDLGKFSLINQLGQVVIKKDLTSKNSSIELNSLPNGLYLIKVEMVGIQDYSKRVLLLRD